MDWSNVLDSESEIDIMKDKCYAIAVRIYETPDGEVMADIKTSSSGGKLRVETIKWTKTGDRDRFHYSGYTLFYDERIKAAKSFDEIR